MLDEMYYKVKSLVRPITRHRRLWERAKYSRARILSPQDGNDLIAASMPQPAAVGKMGSGELAVLRYHLKHADSKGQCDFPAWQVKNLYQIAGVFPPEASIFSRFCTVFAEALRHLDVLAVWFNFGENAARQRFANKASLTQLTALEPYFHDRPWSRHLAGKRVLVVSPFVDTIESQYRRREQVWRAKPEVLPDFQLLTLRSPLSAFLTAPAYPDWFAALDAMREQMASIPFDAAIVGAGAWSLPLVAHAKSLGGWAIHLGGATQLLFGIRGGRWETHPEISAFYNEAWTRPSSAETPPEAKKVEGGCYW
jgi:hypothetical protein